MDAASCLTIAILLRNRQAGADLLNLLTEDQSHHGVLDLGDAPGCLRIAPPHAPLAPHAAAPTGGGATLGIDPLQSRELSLNVLVPGCLKGLVVVRKLTSEVLRSRGQVAQLLQSVDQVSGN